MRVVHESSERDIQVRRVMDALTELAAQIMRISAGAGNVARMGDAMGRLNQAISEMPHGAPGLSHYEALEALRFTTDRFERFDEIRDAIEEIARYSLRFVASRYQGLNTQVRTGGSDIIRATEALEWAREESRRRGAPHVSVEDLRARMEISMLSSGMKEALAFAALKGRPAKKRTKRPNSGSLTALERRAMIVRGTSVYDCEITEKGRHALEAIQSGRDLFGPDQQGG